MALSDKSIPNPRKKGQYPLCPNWPILCGFRICRKYKTHLDVHSQSCDAQRHNFDAQRLNLDAQGHNLDAQGHNIVASNAAALEA